MREEPWSFLQGSINNRNRKDDSSVNSSTSKLFCSQDFMLIAKKSAPKPSKIYPELWHFAAKRHRIYLRRLSGLKYPWTKDSVLSNYRFTNSFRAADRVSQYLIKMIYADLDATNDTLLLRTLLFKIFNKIDTWTGIIDDLGMPAAEQFSYSMCENLLDSLRRDKRSIYSAAYIMPSGRHSGVTKHRMHLHLIRQMIEDRLASKLRETDSLSEAYNLLLAYPTLGPFLAFQYTIDLNYTMLMNHSEQDFVVAGPGALDGISKCFESLGDYSPADVIRFLSDKQEEEFTRYGLKFNGLWGRPLQPVDVQNLLCEVSKYTRVTYPEFRGLTGRKRIKQKFRITGVLPKPFFPPKWGLNQRIESWTHNKRGDNSDTSETRQLDLLAPTLIPDSEDLV